MDIRDLLNRPPDVTYTYTDSRAVDDGEIVDLAVVGVDVHFEGRPITRMSSALFDALGRYVGPSSETEQVAAYQALLAFIVCDATDTAGDGEAEGCLYQSRDTLHVLGGSRVWLHVNGEGWTAMLPQDY